MEEEERLVTCLLCGINTADVYLKRHIRFNHIINNDSILDYMLQLHQPARNSISVQTTITWIREQTTINDQAKIQVSADENYDDAPGDKELICSKCNKADFGSPMIACENCDSWYHSCCVGSSPRLDEEEWSCRNCFKNETNSQSLHYSKTRSKSMNEIFKHKDNDENDIKITAVVKPTRKEILEKTNSIQNAQENGIKATKRKAERKVLEVKKARRSSSPEMSSTSFHDYEEIGDQADSEDSSKPEASHISKIKTNTPKIKSIKKELGFSKNLVKDKFKRENKRNRTNRNEDINVKKERYIKKENEDLIEVTSGKSVCKLCGLGWNLTEELELGPLYKYGVCQAHLHCLMFSSGLVQGGEDHEGILGFLPKHIIQEWRRGSELTCTFCNRPFATVGCCQKLCLKSYHLPCGIKAGAVSEYYANFDSYCPTHKHRRKRGKNYVLSDVGLVPDSVDARASGDSSPELNKQSSLKGKRKTKGRSSESDSCGTEKSYGKQTTRIIKKPKQYDDYETNEAPVPGRARPARSRKPVKLDQSIYKSAKEELAKILQNKYESIDSTFSNLTGRRRNVSHKIIKSRRRRKASSSSSTDSSKTYEQSKRKKRRKSVKKELISAENDEDKNPADFQEAETVDKIKQFLHDTDSTPDCDDNNFNGTNVNSLILDDNNGYSENHVIISTESITKKESSFSDTNDDPLEITKPLDYLTSSEKAKFRRYRCRRCDYVNKDEFFVKAHILEDHEDENDIKDIKFNVLPQEMKVIVKKCIIRSPKNGAIQKVQLHLAEMLGASCSRSLFSSNTSVDKKTDNSPAVELEKALPTDLRSDQATPPKKRKRAKVTPNVGESRPPSNISSLLDSGSSSDSSGPRRTRQQRVLQETKSDNNCFNENVQNCLAKSSTVEESVCSPDSNISKFVTGSPNTMQPSISTGLPSTMEPFCPVGSPSTIEPSIATGVPSTMHPSSASVPSIAASPRRSPRAGYTNKGQNYKNKNSSESDSGGSTISLPKVFRCEECSAEISARRTLVINHIQSKHNLSLPEYSEKYYQSSEDPSPWADIFMEWSRTIILEEMLKHTFPDEDGHYKCDGCQVNFENKADFKRHLPSCLDFPSTTKSSTPTQFTLLHSTIGKYSLPGDSPQHSE